MKRAHSWRSVALGKKSTVSFPWPVCWRCGLVALNNQRSAEAISLPCGGS